jgi:tetratricopeptide (TPR) repeat protein
MKKLFLVLSVFVMMAGSLSAQIYLGGAVSLVSPDTIHSQYETFLEGAKKFYTKVHGLEGQPLYNHLAAVQTYIDFLASQNYRNVPDWERPFLEQVKEGNITDALSGYRNQNLVNLYQGGEPVGASLERYVILLELSGDRLGVSQGLQIMQQIIASDSTNLSALFLFAHVACDLHQGNLAEPYMNSYRNRMAGVDRRAYAEVLALHALNAYRRSRPNDALRWGSRSVMVYDSLVNVHGDPHYDAMQRARLHYAMGCIQFRLGETKESVAHLRKSYELFEYLGAEMPNVQFIERVRILYNMAPLCADQAQYLLADSIYREVDATAPWLFEGNENQQSLFQFNTLRLRGLSAYFANNLEDAHRYFREAGERLNHLENLAPGKNLEAHENLNFNIASVYYKQGNLDKALEYNMKVLDMVLKDTEHDQKRHFNDLTYCYKYIGNTHFAIGYNKYLKAKKRKTKEVMDHYVVARENYARALKYTPREAESRAKFNLCTLIIQGMEKPMAMPKGF